MQGRLNAWYGSRRAAFAASIHEHQAAGVYPVDVLTTISQLEIATVRSLVPLSKTMRVADIGAGGGRWTLSLAPHVASVTAVEPSDLYEVLASRTASVENVTAIHSTFEDFTPPHPFDLVVVYGTLMHQPDDTIARAFIRKAASLLVPGGTLVHGEAIASPRQYWSNWTHVSQEVFDIELPTARYWEIQRDTREYVGYAQEAGLQLRTVRDSHAPLGGKTVLWSVMKRLPVPVLTAYNACASGPWGAVKHLRGIRRMRLMVFNR